MFTNLCMKQSETQSVNDESIESPASWIIITVLEMKQLQEFSCLQDDEECLQLVCPQGMTWNEDVQECLLPDG